MIRTFLFLALTLAGHAAQLRDVPYIQDGGPRQTLDLHLPVRGFKGPRPVIVAIHGGGWSIGDKANAGFVEPKTSWFNRNGYLVASINYRLSPAVRHPSHVEDVCRAIAWLQENVDAHGGDPDRLILLGHSAGAHLAALAAVDHERLRAAGADPAGIRGAILIDGAGYDIARQVQHGFPVERLERMYREAFTTDPAIQRNASPVHRIQGTPPPFLILHVARRADAREQARLLRDALRSHGGRATLAPIRGKSHRTINRDLGKPGDPTTRAVAAFLESTSGRPR